MTLLDGENTLWTYDGEVEMNIYFVLSMYEIRLLFIVGYRRRRFEYLRCMLSISLPCPVR